MAKRPDVALTPTAIFRDEVERRVELYLYSTIAI
jgi:hypothetical protein